MCHPVLDLHHKLTAYFAPFQTTGPNNYDLASDELFELNRSISISIYLSIYINDWIALLRAENEIWSWFLLAVGIFSSDYESVQADDRSFWWLDQARYLLGANQTWNSLSSSPPLSDSQAEAYLFGFFKARPRHSVLTTHRGHWFASGFMHSSACPVDHWFNQDTTKQIIRPLFLESDKSETRNTLLSKSWSTYCSGGGPIPN
jgi:hypothetical protein